MCSLDGSAALIASRLWPFVLRSWCSPNVSLNSRCAFSTWPNGTTENRRSIISVDEKVHLSDTLSESTALFGADPGANGHKSHCLLLQGREVAGISLVVESRSRFSGLRVCQKYAKGT